MSNNTPYQPYRDNSGGVRIDISGRTTTNTSPNNNNNRQIGSASAAESNNQNNQNNNNYFSDLKKGEIAELRYLLKNASNERDGEKIRSSLQRIIYYMTMGIDVSPLFPDIIMVVNTTDLIIKKLVYLYICHYAVHGDNDSLLLLVINTLCLDFQDSNPMVRGLALRSLCSFDSQTTFEYSFKCVMKSLGDPSAYVRKTGLIGLAKLYHVTPEDQRDSTFGDLIPKVYGMIMDQDPQVIVNTLYTLDEIRPNWQVSQQVTRHLMAKFKEANEWGQTAIVNTIQRYNLINEDEIYDFLNFFDDKLKYSNSSLVLSIVKLFLKITENDSNIHEQVFGRLKDPLITLMECSTFDSYEISYAVLSHIYLIISRAPTLFQPDYRYFYCLNKDPLYIKSLKVKILKDLVNHTTVNDILSELSEYVYTYNYNSNNNNNNSSNNNNNDSSTIVDNSNNNNNDISFLKEVIDTIVSIGCSLEEKSESVLDVLLEFLYSDRLDTVVAFCVVALKDYLRVYPESAAKVLPLVTDKLLVLNDSDAIESLLWMLAEYQDDSRYHGNINSGDGNTNIVYIIEKFLDDHSTTPNKFKSSLATNVKIQLLTTCTRLFANQKTSGEIYPILLRLFKACSSIDCDPALRDQCLYYYRLLLYDIDKATKIINTKIDKNESSIFVEDEILEYRDKIFDEFNTLSIIYGKPSSSYIKPPTSVALILSPLSTSIPSSPTMKHQSQQPQQSQTPDLLLEFETSSQQIVDNFTLESQTEIQPEDFQENWLNFEEGHRFDIQLEKLIDTNEMEKLLTSKGIMCLAFGSVAGVTKLYYYAQEIENGPLFLLEILINEKTLLMTLCFKSNNQKRLHNKLVPLFLSTLSKLIPNI
ncbi:adaptor-related protein complex 4 [Heterostelium album PN500]|uniref:AP complex subunit beta n=1 Tax=Heterostelium pallidum (strain ATCC 26659 / Pp 5 / PN500) TaxID=670386 RepID=D3BF27_HETP5|nr:adaptor-related protein complex 4 [Heterostelium album PN500]EFA80508.1 adaptor-related protein complex 4 [Heterostelium album PN500]|eukprot:XP_020432628.1 adaptor-related protein complex 4 [Heterostelium album PN500]